MSDARSGQDGEAGIFISYRRGDTNGEAHAIRERLVRLYGRQRVFMDTDSIEPGTPFAERIDEELDSTGVMLVLIGRSWLGRGRRRLIDQPSDWVGFEVGAGLDRNIPMIPILVEGTPLPSSEDLPESLRPLLTKQTVSLDNNSFESDLDRVERAVTARVTPEVLRQPRVRITRQHRRWALYGAGVVLAAAIVAGILVLLPHNPGPKPPPPVTAATAVLKVPSPELLAEGLLIKGFRAHLPATVSPGSPRLSDTPTAFANPGLVASISEDFNGPAAYMNIRYYVLRNEGAANKFFFLNRDHYGNGYRVTPLTGVGVGDHTQCQSAQQKETPRTNLWACLSLSGNVVTLSMVKGESESAGTALMKALHRDAIRNLATVASTAPHEPLSVPPGVTSTMVRSSSDLSRSLAMPFTNALVPAGMPLPKVRPYGFGTPPRGLLPHPQGDLKVTFGDLDDDLFFYIFDNANHASKWFSNDLRPVDSSGHIDVQRGSLSYPSGFSSSQQAQCGNYYQPGHGGNPAWNVSSCVVQWGNVVIFTRSQLPVNKGKGDINRAVALARSGVLRIAQVIAP
jgi:TIR domain